MNNEDNVKATVSRNAPCPCGSGKKYKLCCGAKAVAAERDAREKKSQFWTPDGVVSSEDTTRSGWPNDRPKWTMTLAIDEEGNPLDDARRVIETFVKPYFDRYCSMTDFEKDDQFEVAVMECFAYGGDPLASAPNVILGRYGQLWTMLESKLENLMADCHSSEVLCEVRWDYMYGGPIVSLAADGTSATFCVAKPVRFDEQGCD